MKEYSREKPKRRILFAAVDLLSRGEELTIRKIAQQADVGTGLINYHFGNRETLVDEAVRMFLREEVVPSGFESLSMVDMEPMERLRTACMGGFGYFAHKPEISRMALLYDLREPLQGDTISKGMELFYPLVRDVAGPAVDDRRIRLAVWLLIGFIQTAFLRAEQFRADTGTDYYNEGQRNHMITEAVEMIIDMLREREEQDQ